MTMVPSITHPEKLFWPAEGYTKLNLARYYDAVFPRLQPFLKDRLLVLERCPDGMGGECFFQKEAPKGLADGVRTKLIHHHDRAVHYVVGGSRETQIAMVNLGCIAVHIWGSRSEHPHQPDWVVFDLDPGSGKFSDAAQAGLLVNAGLEALGVTSFPKTSGSRGLHIFVPIQVGPDYDEVLSFAEEFGKRLAAAHPDTLTVEQRIQSRGNRVYLDPFRNVFGGTVVAPYSVRRREKAPFSMPLRWPDVKASLTPSGFNLGNYQECLAGPDPWRQFFDSRQSLKKAAKALSRI